MKKLITISILIASLSGGAISRAVMAMPASMYQVQGGERSNYYLQPTERVNQLQPASASIQANNEDSDNLQGNVNPFALGGSPSLELSNPSLDLNK